MTDSAYLKRTVVKHEISCPLLESGKRSVRVYLPPGYQEVLSYPVVYCQDGEDFFNFGRVATIANKLILDDEVEPFIVAGIDVDKKHRTSEYSPDGERFESYVQSLIHDIVPSIEQLFPVRQEWTEIVLAGDSLGGTSSLHTALRAPDKFRQVLSLSGAYYPASQAIIKEQQDLSWLHLFMIVGLQETAFETDRGVFNFLDINRKTYDIFKERGAHVHYEEHEGQHLWGFWQQHIPDGLRYFLK